MKPSIKSKVQMLSHKTHNGHTVFLYGRLFFMVSSASRKSKFHFVDLEGYEHWKSVCTCEAWKYGTRPCRHIAASFEAMAAWVQIPQEVVEDWIDALMFLLNMGFSFEEAIYSEALQTITPTVLPKDRIATDPCAKRSVRNYHIKLHETPTATS